MYDQTFHISQQFKNRWKSYPLWLKTELPYNHLQSLVDKGSLTTRLIRESRNNFSVKVIKQQWQSANLSEYRFLGINPNNYCLIREVLLLCHNQPKVYARSILPAISLVGTMRHLRRFGNKPLGQLLFNDLSIKRSEFEIKNFSSNQLPVYIQSELDKLQYNNPEDLLWARRSRFSRNNKPMLVSEFFLTPL